MRTSVTIPDAGETTIPENAHGELPSYSVDFLDCAGEETAARISSALSAVVSEVHRFLPLSRLDGVTFARDYASALRTLDRGFPATEALTSINDDFAIGVAMAPAVFRDNVVKVRVVLHGGLGYGLVGEDDQARSLAMHVLVHQLAQVACVEVMERAFPGISLGRIEDGYEARLYEQMGAAWTGYFASRISAAFEPKLGEGYRDLLSAAIARAQEVVPKARFAYPFDGDLGSLLQTAILSAGAILRYSASLLGYSDGLSVSPYDDESRLSGELEEAGLRMWFDCFRIDLRKISERAGGSGNHTRIYRAKWAYRARSLAIWSLSMENARRLCPCGSPLVDRRGSPSDVCERQE